MNYRHCYHAGNFADVIKHLTLVAVLQALQRKETPFCFLDTHAGIGLYELHSIEAMKKQEYQNGIAKLLILEKSKIPEILQDYINIVKKYNVENKIDFYPGSPLIASELLRDNDEMILSELHKEDFVTLKENFLGQKNIHVHYQDAYLAMKAFLPPRLKRGLVLIDPPFEVVDEFDRIVTALQRALKHWRSGHFIIWYPIKNKSMVKDFYNNIKSLEVENLIIEFSLNQIVDEGKLLSCGVLLINPPWQVKETLESIMPLLSLALDAKSVIFSRC